MKKFILIFGIFVLCMTGCVKRPISTEFQAEVVQINEKVDIDSKFGGVSEAYEVEVKADGKTLIAYIFDTNLAEDMQSKDRVLIKTNYRNLDYVIIDKLY